MTVAVPAPSTVPAPAPVRRFLYYPGCSMDASARAYAASLAAILPPLGLELTEVDDWNCCGATEYLSLSPLGACALIARNLAIAAAHRHDGPGSDTLVAPCSACFVNLAKTDRSMRDDGALAASVNAALAAGGLAYTPGSVTVRHLLEVLLEDVGVDEIRRHVVRPLTGLRVAGYLGCLVSRPDQDHRWSQREHPLALDRLLAVLGAEVVDYPVRTDCCGGHMTQISPDTGFMLIRRLVDTAERTGAHLLATVCPMCQMNIDAYQGEMNHHYGTRYHVPILFFTQLVGLAFGASAKSLGIGSELVSAHDALSRIGIEVPPPDGVGAERRAPAKPVRRSRKDASLPMPPPLPDEEGYR